MKLPKDVKRTKGWFVWTSIFFIGVFLALTIQSYLYVVKTSPEVTDQVVAGKLVFQNNNCMDCHTILGDGAYYASDLTKVISIRGKGFVKALLKDPPKITAQLWPGKYKRVMPNLHLTTTNINDLVAFLGWIGKLDTNGWPPGVPSTASYSKNNSTTGSGEPNSAIALIKQYNCGSCHTIITTGLHTSGVIGPNLSNEAARNRGVDWIIKQISDPTSIPDSEVTKGFEGKQVLMPKFKDQLNEKQIKIVATFINNLNDKN